MNVTLAEINLRVNPALHRNVLSLLWVPFVLQAVFTYSTTEGSIPFDYRGFRVQISNY